MSTLVLLRHGQSQYNLENRFTGWLDVDLTEKGILEAKAAGEKLKETRFKPDVLFTSNLKRAQKTLELVQGEMGIKNLVLFKDEALNERHYGELQGKNKAETAKQFGEEQVKIWRRSFDIAPPKGESLKDTADRTLPYFHQKILPFLKNGKNVLVVAHGNSLRSIVMDIEKLSPDEILKVEIPTAQPWFYRYDAKLKTFSHQK